MSIANLIQGMAKDAGSIVREHYNQQKKWRMKTGISDIVTEVDEMAERCIIERLKTERPEDTILSEESGWSGVDDGGLVWIIDPIDGTSNYAFGLPFFCVSIAVTEGGVPQAGAIYDPLRDDMFFAERGEGATLNGQPIEVTKIRDANAGLISVSWVRGKSKSELFVDIIGELSKYTSQFRRFGSAALALSYVAAGRLNGFIQSGLNPWDVAAATLILEEAGAVATDFDGNKLDMRNSDVEIIAGNDYFHALLINALQSCRTKLET